MFYPRFRGCAEMQAGVATAGHRRHPDARTG